MEQLSLFEEKVTIQPGQVPYCPCGSKMYGSFLPPGPWMGGIRTCPCCHSTYGYVESAGWNTSGKTHEHTTDPKRMCPICSR